MIFIGYPRCSTSNRAQAWLDSTGTEYTFRHIKDENPTAAELEQWHKISGLPLKKFFNTSGMLYKEMNLKDKIPTMSEVEQYNLLAQNGLLVKRPLLIGNDFVLVGFKQAEWEEKINTAKTN